MISGGHFLNLIVVTHDFGKNGMRAPHDRLRDLALSLRRRREMSDCQDWLFSFLAEMCADSRHVLNGHGNHLYLDGEPDVGKMYPALTLTLA